MQFLSISQYSGRSTLRQDDFNHSVSDRDGILVMPFQRNFRTLRDPLDRNFHAVARRAAATERKDDAFARLGIVILPDGPGGRVGRYAAVIVEIADEIGNILAGLSALPYQSRWLHFDFRNQSGWAFASFVEGTALSGSNQSMRPVPIALATSRTVPIPSGWIRAFISQSPVNDHQSPE